METFYLIIVCFLLLLAFLDLNVGVSNDAVNFLSSAVGTRAVPMKYIMLVASIGVFVGATSSSGMMEISRNGVFHPEYFYATELIRIFLAVMLSDVILLNIFNSLGMPTSTTVSMVFELIGGTVAVTMMKLRSGQVAADFGDLVNTDKALTMILGIFLSVAIAFVFGWLVQYIARFIFTFNYKKNLKWKIGIFGGIAITSILYFMLMKGFKNASFMTSEASQWIEKNTLQIILGSLIFFTLLMHILNLLKVNVFKIIIMVGTFSLAMAFAGNDLVNFIGVPLAGLSTYQDFAANGSGDMSTYLMDALNQPAHTPIYFLGAAGLVMVVSLVTSRKAKVVLQTSLDLSKQGNGNELFGSSSVARSIVRVFTGMASFFDNIMSDKMKAAIERRFNTSDIILADKASFDLIRGSVNLVLAGLLIALGTSLKLPLSTTYVAFMVAMGSSLADRAWSRDSAVFRVTGVFSVIGGWLFTALAAFTLAFCLALLFYVGGAFFMVLMIIVVLFIIIKTNLRKKTSKKGNDEVFEQVMTMSSEEQDKASELTLNHVRDSFISMINFSETAYRKIIDAFLNEDIRMLRDVITECKDQKMLMKVMKRREIQMMRQFDSEEMFRRNTWFHLGYNCVEQILYSLRRICEPCKEHVDNSFSPFNKKYLRELEAVEEIVLWSIDRTRNKIEYSDYGNLETLREKMKGKKDEILQIRDNQIERIHDNNESIDDSLLYLNIIQESYEIVVEFRHLLRDMEKIYRKPE